MTAQQWLPSFLSALALAGMGWVFNEVRETRLLVERISVESALVNKMLDSQESRLRIVERWVYSSMTSGARTGEGDGR